MAMKLTNILRLLQIYARIVFTSTSANLYERNSKEYVQKSDSPGPEVLEQVLI